MIKKKLSKKKKPVKQQETFQLPLVHLPLPSTPPHPSFSRIDRRDTSRRLKKRKKEGKKHKVK